MRRLPAGFNLFDNAESSCLGLIGGLGVGATVHYYRALAAAHERRQQSLHLLIVHADMRRVLGYVQTKQYPDLTEDLASLIGQLKDGGADLAAVAAVTPHICFGELAPKSPLPLVDLLKIVRESVLGKRVALFGTRFTVETDLFGALQGDNTVRPQPAEVDEIHNIYMRTALRGEGAEDDRQALTSLAHKLIQREGLEALVFAGTDLALLFNESNTAFPFIDCSQLHLEAIMNRLFP
jgi:aspartate racemase